MNIVKENVDALNAVVKINLIKDDYLPKVDTVIKDYTKKVDLKGFRKGHVPVGLVKKMYGNQILVETLDKIINEELNNYIKENKIEILGYPLSKTNGEQEFDVNNPVDYEFLFELGLAPAIELKVLSPQTKITQYDITVNDELISEEVERLRKRFGKMTNPDTIEKEDTIYVELEELDEKGNLKENGVKNTTTIALDMIKDKKASEKVLTLKKEDSMEMNIFEAIDRDQEEIAKNILGKDSSENISSNFKMTIKNVNRVEQAEFNQEFFDKIYGEGNVKSLEELKAKLTEEYQDFLKKQSEKKLNNDLIEKLIHGTEIQFPDVFLKKWIKASNTKQITDDQIEKEYSVFTHDLKWNLIANKIIKDQKIEVKKEELRQKMKDSIKEQFKLYTKEEISEEQLEKMADSFSNNEEQVKNTANSLMDEKLFGILKSTFTIEQKAISLKEFNLLS